MEKLKIDEQKLADALLIVMSQTVKELGLDKGSSMILCCWSTMDAGYRGKVSITKKFITEFIKNCFEGEMYDHMQNQADKVRELIDWEKTRINLNGEDNE